MVNYSSNVIIGFTPFLAHKSNDIKFLDVLKILI